MTNEYTGEEYVSLKTAKLLKEAGFDWECIAYYKPEIFGDELKISKIGLVGNHNHPQYSMVTEVFSAPTQAVAQRWSREVKAEELFFVRYSPSAKAYVVIFEKKHHGFLGDKKGHIMGFPTYEDALEAGLQKCLTLLIENKL